LVAARVFGLVHALVGGLEQLLGRVALVRRDIHRIVRYPDAHRDVHARRLGIWHESVKVGGGYLRAELLRELDRCIFAANPCANEAVCANIEAKRRSNSSPDGCPCVSFQALK